MVPQPQQLLTALTLTPYPLLTLIASSKVARASHVKADARTDARGILAAIRATLQDRPQHLLPFHPRPTTSPSKSPSASPTARPTDAPTSEGMGYCSDDSSKFCMNVDACGCSSARRRLLDLDTHNNHMHRALQNCSGINKKRQCNNDSSCTWSGRNCVAITPPPVSSPTNPPSKSPMGVTEPPSKAPIDSPTRSPTNAVRLHYNIFETLFTIVCMLLTSCFSLCLHSCSLPKLLPRVNGKILHTCHFFISKRFVLQS